MTLSLCSAIAGVQLALALGALAVGQPQVAGVFAIFAAVQIATLIVEGCGLGSACRSRLVAPEVGTPER